MTIELTPEQEQAIQNAVKSGVVRSVDEFIDTAIALLPHPKNHTGTSRHAAVRSMEEFGEKYRLSLGEPITRKLLHDDCEDAWRHETICARPKSKRG